MKLSKYPKEVYILWLISFIVGIELIGAFLIPFLMDWGGLSQFQTQFLQSWFTLLVFVLEVPTGLIGDIKGRRFSVLCGFLFLIIGPIVYGSIPHIGIFLLGEFLFAVGVAFNSGAQEALLYDTLKEKGKEKSYTQAKMINDNLRLIAMLLSSFFAGFFIEHFQVNQIFQFTAVTSALAFVLVLIFIREPKVELEEDFIPDYKLVFKRAVKNIRKNAVLRKLVTFMTLISSVSYFVIWFYQVILKDIAVGEEQFGYFRVILLVSEIVLAYIIIHWLSKAKKKSLLIAVTVIAIIIGFLSPVLKGGIIGVSLFIIFGGGIGMKYRSIFSGLLNKHIKSEERATTLSFISMLRRMSLTVFNPIFGYLADVSMNMTLLVLTGVLVITMLFFLPLDEDLRGEVN